MPELVLNDACLSGGFATLDEAADFVVALSPHVAELVAAEALMPILRTGDPELVNLGEGINLQSLLLHLLGSGKHREEGRFFARLSLRYPVEDELVDDEYSKLLDWRLKDYPDAYGLLLCAASARVALSLTKDVNWWFAPLNLVLEENFSTNPIERRVSVPHIHSKKSAIEVLQSILAERRAAIPQAEFWDTRAASYPFLQFAPSVRKDISDLTSSGFESVRERLVEINASAQKWAQIKTPAPAYISKITGESGSTMDHYGKYRIFKGSDGKYHSYEKHARLPNGLRIHLIEIASDHVIEIGYIGSHLPTVKFPD